MASTYLDVDDTASAASQMMAFLRYAAKKTSQAFPDYSALHNWACKEPATFWSLFLSWHAPITSGSPRPSLTGGDIETAKFFPELKLNFAQNLLRQLPNCPDSSPAVIWRTEDGNSGELTRSELRGSVLAIAGALRENGVVPGDRIVAIVNNGPSAVKACLASSAIGAVWSSVAPDLGADAVLRRFAQLAPSVLFVDVEYRYQGRTNDLKDQISALVAKLPSLRILIVTSGQAPAVSSGLILARMAEYETHAGIPLDALEHFPFDHPLFILFTSGTTGAPKCIIHGAGGTLLETLKEHSLHANIDHLDRFFFLTTCGWMIWNWQLPCLALGAALFLSDGSVAYPTPEALLRFVDQQRVTVFGLSPTYLQLLKEVEVSPRSLGQFDALRLILSTGSVLQPEQFDWVRENFTHLAIHSISGGTDIMGCFVNGNPLLPIYRGESPCISLGLDVRAMVDGRPERLGTGELICVTPFPSRPVGIWGDESGRLRHTSYYAQHEGVWTHGDIIELTSRGSARIIGRSDGTMKISGVRIGPSELYAVVLQISGILQALAVPREDPDDIGGTSIVLLVMLKDGRILDRELTSCIERELLTKASRNHVPGIILQVSALPQTLNGKYSERAARDIVNGRQPPNREALRNPECLDEIAEKLAEHFSRNLSRA